MAALFEVAIGPVCLLLGFDTRTSVRRGNRRDIKLATLHLDEEAHEWWYCCRSWLACVCQGPKLGTPARWQLRKEQPLSPRSSLPHFRLALLQLRGGFPKVNITKARKMADRVNLKRMP